MSKINLEVRDNYEFLQELSYEEKNLNTNTIVLEPKRNNRDWLKQSSNIDHSTIEENITLIVEKKISFFKYGIKLHCPNFTSQPVSFPRLELLNFPKLV